MISGLADWSRILGPALFGAVAGGMYGYVTVVMEKPLAAGTTGWTDSGKRLALTSRIANYGSMGTALLTLADRDAVPIQRLRRIMVAVEQLLSMQSRADQYAQRVEDVGDEVARAEIAELRQDAEFMAESGKYRSVALAMLAEGLSERDISCGADGTPYEEELRYAVVAIVQGIDDIMFNINIAVRKWRGG